MSIFSDEMAQAGRKALGDLGEAAAAAWLTAQGYEVLDRNVRTRFGEIDLVIRGGDAVIFVEVKCRAGTGFGHPAEAIAAPKQRRLARLASGYLLAHRLHERSVRFDAVAVFVAAGKVVRIEHIPDAFGAS